MRTPPPAALALAVLAIMPLCRAAAQSPSEPRSPIRQTIRIDAEERFEARRLRVDGPINSANVLGLPEWLASMKADIDWSIRLWGRLGLGLSPLVTWPEAGGGIDGLSLLPAESQHGLPSISLPLAEARLSLPELGLEAIFGKLRPEFGANYIEPLSATKPAGRESPAEGFWMAGLFLSLGDAAFEAYCEAARDPAAACSISALFGGSEAGLLWRRSHGQSFGAAYGAWWRGQLGDGALAYAEASLRESGAFLDIAGLPARGIGWNADFLAGLSLTPAGAEASFYLEYRHRGAGYSERDYEALAALPAAAHGAALAGFPYLQASRDAVGIHAMSETGSGRSLSWSATCLYLFPDGLDASAKLKASLADRFSASAELAISAPLRGAAAAASEEAFRPDALRLALAAGWSLDAEEAR
jgi:hypothetical protein